MPKAPNENRAKAEQMFNEGMALVEIAKKLGISEGTVRSWKARNWGKKKPQDDQKKTSATLQKKKRNVAKEQKATEAPRRRGGQPGNKNAFKHGGYSKTYFDTLDEDELEMVMSMPDDEEQLLLDQIRLFVAREHRIMRAINSLRKQEADLALVDIQRQEQKRAFVSDEEKERYEEIVEEKIEKGERLPGMQYALITNTEPKHSAIARLEKELSVVQGKKTEAIRALATLRIERQKLNAFSAGSEVVDDWVKAILEEESDGNTI